MSRIIYDFKKFYEEKSKLPKPDGIHCIICGKKLSKRKRKYCSEECYNNWLKKINIPYWNKTREFVIERDNYTCQKCGSKNNLHVHHIISIKDGGDEFDIDNCITLCEDCHKYEHSKIKNLRKKHKMLEEFK